MSQRTSYPPDEILCVRINNGDETAFALLIKKHKQRLSATLRFQYSSLLKGAIEPHDVISDFCVHMIQKIRTGYQIKDPKAAYGFLARSLQNRMSDRWKAEQSVTPHRLAFQRDLEDQILEDQENMAPAEQTNRSTRLTPDVHGAYQKARNGMTESERAVMDIEFQDHDVPNKTKAEMLNTTEGSYNVLRSKAMKKIIDSYWRGKRRRTD